jgi:hypothetical protein
LCGHRAKQSQSATFGYIGGGQWRAKNKANRPGSFQRGKLEIRNSKPETNPKSKCPKRRGRLASPVRQNKANFARFGAENAGRFQNKANLSSEGGRGDAGGWVRLALRRGWAYHVGLFNENVAIGPTNKE